MNTHTSQQDQGAAKPTDTAPRKWWWRILGVRRRHGRRLPIGLTLWGSFLLVMVVAGGGMIGFAEYSMQPDFCRSCHIMEPYYQAWHQSTHKDVPCGDCHFEPGWRHTLKGKWQATSQAVKYMTDTYGSKPHAEVRDVSCLREGCHERRVLEGDVEWTVQSQRGQDVTIRFDHTPHLEELRRGKKLRCVSCHSQMVQGKHIVVTLDTCFLCHFKGLKHGRDDETLGGCAACHDAPKQEIRLTTGMFNHAEFLNRGVTCENCHADVVSGDGAVPRQVCWNCHNQPQHLARFSDTVFLHANHVTDHKVECASCHVQIEHHLSAAVPEGSHVLDDQHMLTNSGACGQCHEKTHAGPLELYSGIGGRGVDDMPSPMYRAQVDCIACHRENEYASDAARVVGQTYVAAQASCDSCHGEHYSDRLDQWKATIDEHLLLAQAACDRARSALDAAESLDGVRELKLRRALDDAEFNVRFVGLGRGVHNLIYATALLNFAIEQCDTIVTDLSATQ